MDASTSPEDFVDLVVPELQRRQIMRDGYELNKTFREQLRAFCAQRLGTSVAVQDRPVCCAEHCTVRRRVRRSRSLVAIFSQVSIVCHDLALILSSSHSLVWDLLRPSGAHPRHLIAGPHVAGPVTMTMELR